MKVGRFPFLILLLAISGRALMPARSYAAASEPTSAQEQRSPHQASDRNHLRSRASLAMKQANRPKQLPDTWKRSIARNTANLHQPDSGKSGAAAKEGLVQKETASNIMPARPPGTVRPSAATLNSSLNPLPGNVRHRGPNSAVVGIADGGSPNLKSGSTGAIDGTRMHRRP